jgi:hypothetical protein
MLEKQLAAAKQAGPGRGRRIRSPRRSSAHCSPPSGGSCAWRSKEFERLGCHRGRAQPEPRAHPRAERARRPIRWDAGDCGGAADPDGQHEGRVSAAGPSRAAPAEFPGAGPVETLDQDPPPFRCTLAGIPCGPGCPPLGTLAELLPDLRSATARLGSAPGAPRHAMSRRSRGAAGQARSPGGYNPGVPRGSPQGWSTIDPRATSWRPSRPDR